MDLAEWRRQDIGQACREYARRFPDRIAFWDQSILNAVLWQRRTRLDKTWNLEPPNSLRRLALYPRAHTIDANVHYVGAGKPWLEANPFGHFYHACAAEIASLIPPELAPRRPQPGDAAERWQYFAQRAFRNYGGIARRGVRTLFGR